MISVERIVAGHEIIAGDVMPHRMGACAERRVDKVVEVEATGLGCHLAHRQAGPLAQVDVLKEAGTLAVDPSLERVKERRFLGRRSAVADLGPTMLKLKFG